MRQIADFEQRDAKSRERENRGEGILAEVIGKTSLPFGSSRLLLLLLQLSIQSVSQSVNLIDGSVLLLLFCPISLCEHCNCKCKNGNSSSN